MPARNTKSIKFFEPAMAKILAKTESSSSKLNELLGIHESDGMGISEYWRKNTYHQESSELAAVLRALRKIAGYIGRNTGSIEWVGMSQDPKGAIVLDPGMVMGRYPIPARKFDYLAGLVIHESFHKTEWSDLLWKKTDAGCGQMEWIEKVVFQKLVFTGENIYVDLFSEKSVLAIYARVARDLAMTEHNLELQMAGAGAPTVDYLMQLWWQQAFDAGGLSCLTHYEESLSLLDRLTNDLRDITRSEKGVAKRCDMRSHLYLDTWHTLKDKLSDWSVINKTLMWYPETVLQEKKTQSQKSRSQPRLSKTMIQNIEERLAYDSSDITPIIRSIVGIDNEEVVPTSRWDFNILAHPVIDYKLVARLKGILQNYSDRRTILNRGLTSGRVDSRKLYRAPINGRCFLEKQKIPLLDWSICLLVDATGSMKGPKWQMVENTLGTIHKAFSGFQNRLQAYAYFEVEGVCMISSLIKENRILSIPPCGQTASGQAIIAAAHFMPVDKRRRFLIHITDGESNFGCDVQYGINHCITRHIHLVTLGVAYKDRDAMRKQYGKTIQFIDHFGQLPSAVEKLLKWTLLKNKHTLRN